MHDFVLQMRMPRVVFGAGSLRQVRHEVEALGAERALVLSTPGQKALGRARRRPARPARRGRVLRRGDACAGRDGARRPRTWRSAWTPTALVAIGGGSTTGLGKALALGLGPAGDRDPDDLRRQRDDDDVRPHRRRRQAHRPRSRAVLPRAVIYDPELSLGLPFAITVVSAINAIAHAAEGLYAPDGNPVIDLFAEEGIRRSRRGPAAPAARPARPRRRAATRWSAPGCAARCMGSVTVGLHHKLCHTLGGSFGLPHAELHTVVLPHALAYNAPAAPRGDAQDRRRLGRRRARPPACSIWPARHGAATSLQAIGMERADLDRAADLAVQSAVPEPASARAGAAARAAAARLGRRSSRLSGAGRGAARRRRCGRAQAVSRFTPFSSQA